MKLQIAPLLACLTIGLAIPPMSHAAQWRATVGAQSSDMGHQAMAFLPNEIWIHAGDSVTWRFATDEIHTVSFLVANEVRPPFFLGCPPGPPPGVTPDGSSFNGTRCVNTGPMLGGQTYTVNFPTAGNYKLVCLVHESMTGVVHVLAPSVPLPHGQGYYDQQARQIQHDLLARRDRDEDHDKDHAHGHDVTAGVGSISATPGGHNTLSVMRFMQPKVEIRVGDTVEWNNEDPVTPHTITFGTEPGNPLPPSSNVSADADGALHATISSAADSVHSGLILASGHERIGVAQAPLGVTRFRVTFTHAGVYPYICALHDVLGMKGLVVVRP
jgi:plastocyanin